MYDVVIIGAGPAGLTASIYARRNNKKVLVLEGGSYGGQIINTPSIDNYPALKGISGFDYSVNLYNQSISFGTEYKTENVISIKDGNDYKEVTTNKNTYKTKTIIIATGAYNRLLGVDREKELTGKGVSYCATCDGNFFKGKEVAVVGGGNTAVEDAIYLTNIVSKVYIILRRDEFRADDRLVEELKNKENVEIIYNSQVVKLNGENSLESITIKDKDNNTKDLNVSCVFVCVGRIPQSDIFKGIIDLDEYGYIIAGEDCHTNKEGIFVCGDVRTKTLRQLVTATSDGAIAADEAIKYVNSK